MTAKNRSRQEFFACIKSRQRRKSVTRTVAQRDIEEWNLLPSSLESATVRVVTIKHPPAAIEGITPDISALGQVYDLPAQLGILMIAAGWARSETRKESRRENDLRPPFDRRRENDRRSAAEF